MRVGLVIPPAAFLLDDRAFCFIGVLQIAAAARGDRAVRLPDGTYRREKGPRYVEVVDLTGHSRTCPKKVHDESCAQETLHVSHARIAELARRVDVIGFYSMAALHFFVSTFHQVAKAANPAVVTVLGGPHASTAPERCALEGWDYVVASDQGGGGGEPGFVEVLRRLESRAVGAA